nr:UbiA family prenyltransferase [Fundidesulfovibrio soli]
MVRPRLCFLAVVAALAGYVCFKPVADSGLACALAGALLLAAGSGALNQLQERATDRLMARTASRPLASGRLGVPQALVFIVTSLCLSLALLAQTDISAVAVWAVVLLVYNGLYTPLKRRTPFAILAGGIAGAMPPLLGWCAAGGEPSDCRALALSGMLYLWQVPHFWMLVRRHEGEYRAAGLPVFAGRLWGRSGFVVSIWLACYGLSVLLLPALGLVSTRWLGFVLVGVGASVMSVGLLGGFRGPSGFQALNASLLFLLCTLIVDAASRAV